MLHSELEPSKKLLLLLKESFGPFFLLHQVVFHSPKLQGISIMC